MNPFDEAKARSAYDIMLNRGWFAVKNQYGFCACRMDKTPWAAQPEGIVTVLPSVADCAGHPDWIKHWPDPFTCLVEADKWYRANRE